MLWPPAFQGRARTEGRGRDLGGGQAFSTGSLFAPHVLSSTPHWSFELYSLPPWWNKCYNAENKLISFGCQHIPPGYNVAPFWKSRQGQLYIFSSTRESFAVKAPVSPHAWLWMWSLIDSYWLGFCCSSICGRKNNNNNNIRTYVLYKQLFHFCKRRR